jgi:hypothetical protein
MSKEMKYVIINHTMPILFTKVIEHFKFKNLNPTSAGFCKITKTDKFEANCYGESIGLNIKSNPEDDKIINCMLNEIVF